MDQTRSRSTIPASQTWDPDRYAKNARFVSDLAQPLLALLAPSPGERILDLGCGDGVLARGLVDLGCEVVAVDSSAEQIEAARRLGVDARVMDGQALTFAGEFDAVFSNAALHWMKDQARVLEGVHRALRPGGRFVGELGGHGNVDRIHRALVEGLDRRGHHGREVSPWFFPTTGAYRQQLVAAGFEVVSISLAPRPTPLPGDLLGWLQTFAESFTRVLPEEERPPYLDEIRAALQPHLCGPDGSWIADYVRLRFFAIRPSASRRSRHLKRNAHPSPRPR